MELKREALRLYAVTDRAWLSGRTLDGQVAVSYTHLTQPTT